MENSTSDVGIVSILTLIFVVLKLTNLIDWSWWWVLSPLWIGWGLLLVIIIVFVIAEYLSRNV